MRTLLAPVEAPVRLERLKLSTDRKVAPVSRYKTNAARWEPIVMNAIGLPAGNTCPGTTKACDACYAKAIENYLPSVAALLAHNERLLRACGSNVKRIETLLDSMMVDYRASVARAVRILEAPVPLVFRIHWDGDFYSRAYARAWANVIARNADVTFWAYTRSFVPRCNVVDILADIPNLSLYLSADKYNLSKAQAVALEYPSVQLAILAESFDDGQAIALKTLGRKAPRCPENAGKVPLVGADGRGACVACGLCVTGKAPVLFSTSKR